MIFPAARLAPLEIDFKRVKIICKIFCQIKNIVKGVGIFPVFWKNDQGSVGRRSSFR
jgi:hypothetical protein